MDNSTFLDDHFIPLAYRQPMKKAYEIILASLLVVIMLAMGCIMTVDQIKLTLKRPVGILIGMVCQFVLLPLSAFGLIHAFQLPHYSALGFLILACCPGGTTSNIFTYWVKGDVTLSVCMTTASTIMAFGMMPLNLWIYSRPWTTENSPVPFINILITLASVLGPVGIGVIIRWKFPRIAGFLTKAGSAAGLLGILVSIIMQSLLFPQAFRTGWKLWMCALLFPLVGFGLGYLFALICRRSHAHCRTIAYETGCQNVSLSLTLISMSFPVEIMGKVNLFPLVFSIFLMLEAFFAVGVFKCYFKFRPPSKEANDIPANTEKGLSLKTKETTTSKSSVMTNIEHTLNE